MGKKLKYYTLTFFVLINLFIAGQSLTPGGESAEQSNWFASVAATIASWVIPVEPSFVEVESLTIQGPTQIYVGDPGLLTVALNPTNATNQTVVWSSSDSNILDITSGGRLIPKQVGTVTIHAQSHDPNVSDDYVVEVIPFPLVTSFEASLEQTSIEVGDAQTIVLSNILPLRAIQTNIRYTSSDPSIAFVSERGVITGIASGQVQIHVGLLETIVETFDVTILPSENIIPSSFTVENEQGESGPFESFIYSTYSLTLNWGEIEPTNTAVTWISSDETIARVTDQGQVYGYKFEGTATIRAQSQSNPYLISEVEITMKKAKPIGVSLIPVNNRYEVSAGSRLRINYTLTPEQEGLTVYDQQLQWTSSHPELADVASFGDYGVVIGNQLGNVTITATSVMDETVTATLEITVIKPNLFTDQEFEDFASFFRKAVGHFLLFGLNGFFGYWTFYLFMDPKKQPWFISLSLAIGVISSILSEILQAITPQRTSSPIDMLLNFSGYLTFNLILWLIWFIYFQFLRPLHHVENRNRIKRSNLR